MTDVRKKWAVNCSVCGRVERIASHMVAEAIALDHEDICTGNTDVERLGGSYGN